MSPAAHRPDVSSDRFLQRFHAYEASQKFLTFKLKVSIWGMAASVFLLLIALFYARKPEVSDGLALIPLILAIVPFWWLYRHNRASNQFAQEAVQELKRNLAMRKHLGELKFKICDFMREIFRARAAKLQIETSVPVLRPAGAPPDFEERASIAWEDPKVDRRGVRSKIQLGRIGPQGDYANLHIARVRIELGEEHYLGTLTLVTEEKLSVDDHKLLSVLEDEVDTWLSSAIDRYQTQLVLDMARALDDVANMVDSAEIDRETVLHQMLDVLAAKTSSSNAHCEVLGKALSGSANKDRWNEREWGYVRGMYQECRQKVGDPNHAHVERSRAPWDSGRSELILLPVFFDRTERHLGYFVFQAPQFEVGVETALSHVEDLVLDNLILRLEARA